jgi:hypothetical protein
LTGGTSTAKTPFGFAHATVVLHATMRRRMIRR